MRRGWGNWGSTQCKEDCFDLILFNIGNCFMANAAPPNQRPSSLDLSAVALVGTALRSMCRVLILMYVSDLFLNYVFLLEIAYQNMLSPRLIYLPSKKP